MRLVVTGGGTGGHIYPAVDVAREMGEMVPSARVLYVGTREGMESGIVPREGIDFQCVRSSGVAGKSPLVAAKGLLKASLGVKDAAGILRSFRPDVVLGTGGYASGPVVMSAYLLGIPGAIQEQNAVPGKTNRFLSRVSGRTFAAWEYSRRFFPRPERVVVTGNPVRKSLLQAEKTAALRHYGLPAGARVVLLLGGSRGARTLCDAGVELAKRGLGGAYLLFVTGTEYYATVASRLEAGPGNGIDGAEAGDIIIRPYEHNMAMAYGAADLVVSRAGGMTLSETTALGLPSVIVPSPNVAGNHQEHNARTLEEAGAAIVVRERGDVAGEVCGTVLSLLKDGERLSSLRQAANKMGRPGATRDICRGLVEIARKG